MISLHRRELDHDFGRKGGEYALAESMKERFKMVKKPRRYAISSISDPTVKVATYILAGKVMRKCCIDEVSVLVIVLAAQCTVMNPING